MLVSFFLVTLHIETTITSAEENWNAVDLCKLPTLLDLILQKNSFYVALVQSARKFNLIQFMKNLPQSKQALYGWNA